MQSKLNGIICFIGIGSNMGEPYQRCQESIVYLGSIKGCKMLRRSSFYRTEPVGYLEQDWFINAVAEIRTELTPRELLKELKAIETMMGRQQAQLWGPRIIDLDILLYGQEIIHEPDLVIPHALLHKRRFVMEPLHEIAPYVIHPAFGVSIAGLRQRLADNSKIEIIQ